MFSGKTSRMFLEGERLQRAGKSIIYLKSERDKRYSDDVSLTCTHAGDKMKSVTVLNDDLLNAIQECGEKEVVCIDEAQFMTNLVEFCEYMATKLGKHVIIAALDGDFKKDPFPNVAKLLSHCEKIKKLRSICVECGASASFTRKIAGSQDEIVEIGGTELYVPTCRKHHTGKLSDDTLPRMKQTNERIKLMKSI